MAQDLITHSNKSTIGAHTSTDAASVSNRRCVVIGPFPPPVHGIAVANDAMRRLLAAIGATVDAYDLSPGSLDRSLLVRLRRLRPFLQTVIGLLRTSAPTVSGLYMSVSGGVGQVYESVFAFIARIKGIPIFLHHHSYAYLAERTVRTRLLFLAAGPDTTHIALSTDMQDRLSTLYGGSAHTIVISNASLAFEQTPRDTVRSLRDGAVRLGFLSNISDEKGIFDFLDVLEQCSIPGVPVVAWIGGPFQDEETRRAVVARLRGIGNARYLGPVFGNDKQAFWDGIDAFLFPTKYVNEAEPIVVLEALANGIPVIANRRGSLGTMVTSACGVLVDPGDSFAMVAVRSIDQWRAQPDLYSRASLAASCRFEEIAADSRATLDALTREIAFGGSERSWNGRRPF